MSTLANDRDKALRTPRSERVRSRARSATKARLRAAALAVLERDGVLAGLALQDVAKEAGVSQALINRYFGTRQALLREALTEKRERYAEEFKAERPRPIMHRVRWVFRGGISDPQWGRMMALLALDGDDEFTPLDLPEQTVGDLRAGMAAGDLVDDLDPEATYAVFMALTFGWSVLREATARQIAVPIRDLDDRAETVMRRMVEVFIRGSGTHRKRLG